MQKKGATVDGEEYEVLHVKKAENKQPEIEEEKEMTEQVPVAPQKELQNLMTH